MARSRRFPFVTAITKSRERVPLGYVSSRMSKMMMMSVPIPMYMAGQVTNVRGR
jgi:hypothetical protein